MIDRARQYYLARTPREKFMLLVMLLVAALIWLTFFTDRLDAFMSARAELSREMKFQRAYLERQESIERRVEEGVASLDTDQTLSATNLVVEVGRLARRHQLNPRTGAPSTEQGDIFSYHSLRLNVNGASLADLINFTSDLQRRAPYIGIDEISITADRSNPTLLNAVYRIYAVELTL